jgi:hypothetical protein
MVIFRTQHKINNGLKFYTIEKRVWFFGWRWVEINQWSDSSLLVNAVKRLEKLNHVVI